MLLGAIDKFERNYVSGWLVNVFNPDDVLVIEVFADDELVMAAEPEFVREDVDEEYAALHIGFAVEIPQTISSQARLTVRVAGHDFDFDGQAVEPGAFSSKSQGEQAKKTFQFPKVLYRADQPRLMNMQSILHKAHDAFDKRQPIFIVPPFVDWNLPLFQRPQHIAAAMAELGAMVIYFSPSYMYDEGDEVLQIRDNLYLCKQPALFEQYIVDGPPSFIDLYSTAWYFSKERISAWREAGHYIVYEYVDHIDEAISGKEGADAAKVTFAWLAPSIVDVVIPTAGLLYDEMRARFPSDMVAMSPNGVEIERFIGCKETNPVIDEIRKAHGNKPVIGYVGALADWLDYELIADLARHRPDLTFVMVGPKYTDSITLPEADNLVWPGPFPYPTVPTLLNSFDVAWIPFKEGDIAKTTSPLKLFEYFAARKPVLVNSDMRECVAYKEVFSASDVQSFSEALDAALAKKDDAAYKKAVLKHAHAASWQERARTMLDAFEHVAHLRYHYANRSRVPYSYMSAGVGSLERERTSEALYEIAQTENGMEVIPLPMVARPGDYKSLSVDMAQCEIPTDIDWVLSLRINCSAPPPPRVSVVDVLVDGKLCCSFDGSRLQQPCDILFKGDFVRDKVVTLRLRGIRADIRRYWNGLTFMVEDAYVMQRKMKRNLVVSLDGVEYQ
ncbi:glycosyltransferase [Hyphomonas pacifica]|uniref:Glycosyl transferase family 1 domain-containing protein n=1 Tax=Hyphomonas pacifica TaxID=1280941 RepID=A0A062TQC1_9PROT|nr:glycosyltransferase [Hyphomonas pacifica]KCZ49349.1 hypothetical protein HY2_02910 [Hyphomonas pacifica]RAN33155.1 hypothetical protein HY3_02075 [Hyphomonas pacifica]